MHLTSLGISFLHHLHCAAMVTQEGQEDTCIMQETQSEIAGLTAALSSDS